MLKVFAIIAVILALSVIALLAYAATRPDDFRISRAKTIMAPPDRIFPLISNLRKFNAWNPFAKHDPPIDIVYRGPESGEGATHEWNSDGRAGKGRLEITGVSAPSSVAMKLDIWKPIEGHNDILFTLKPNGGGTDVTWSMTGKTPFIGKIMSVFMSMDRMVGGEFEKGLTDLKTIAER